MTRYYRVILINRETGERRMLYIRWTSKKKAIKWASDFCMSMTNNIADFEIVEC